MLEGMSGWTEEGRQGWTSEGEEERKHVLLQVHLHPTELKAALRTGWVQTPLPQAHGHAHVHTAQPGGRTHVAGKPGGRQVSIASAPPGAT